MQEKDVIPAKTSSIIEPSSAEVPENDVTYNIYDNDDYDKDYNVTNDIYYDDVTYSFGDFDTIEQLLDTILELYYDAECAQNDALLNERRRGSRNGNNNGNRGRNSGGNGKRNNHRKRDCRDNNKNFGRYGYWDNSRYHRYIDDDSYYYQGHQRYKNNNKRYNGNRHRNRRN